MKLITLACICTIGYYAINIKIYKNTKITPLWIKCLIFEYSEFKNNKKEMENWTLLSIM